MGPGPRITVIMPLYRAAEDAPGLVASLAAQRHPDHENQSDWMQAILIDNASDDGTPDRVKDAFAEHGDPDHWHLVENEENLGLAHSLNKALEMAGTELVLTCHADCRFGGEDYVAEMLRLLEENPDAGGIGGKPAMPAEAIDRVERVYAIANLMDVLPTNPDEPDLVPVGFCEGRCDGFRMEALRAVGMYGDKLRLAGEDQIISAQMRAAGFSTYQAPHLRYRLSVSAMQDSLGKLVAMQRRFGRVNPTILLGHRGTGPGVVGGQAGKNRQARTMMRGLQILGGVATVGVAASLLTGRSKAPWLVALAGVTGGKLALAREHIDHLEARPLDLASWLAIQPGIDVAFTLGLIEGAIAMATGKDVW